LRSWLKSPISETIEGSKEPFVFLKNKNLMSFF
jgi:hypothetical protein